MARHTAYARVEPPGTWVARYYCRKGHVTFSLLPDCLASRLSSTLAEVEQVIDAVEEDGVGVAAARLRPDIGLQGALRWVSRRVRGVHDALVIAVGLVPALLAGATVSLAGFRAALSVTEVLPAVRQIAEDHLSQMPPPVGLGRRSRPRNHRPTASQQEMGADP